MALFDRVASPAIAPPRWPGLVASVGGEAAIRDFMRANPADGGGNRWERGFTFVPNDCDFNAELPFPGCSGMVYDVPGATPDTEEQVDYVPMYFWEAARCSTLSNDPDEVTRRATTRLTRTTSHKLERELWTNVAHIASGEPGQALTTSAIPLNGSAVTPLIIGFTELQDAWGDCAQGGRAMIHVTPRTAVYLQSAHMIRREGSLLLDLFDNVIVAGTGYDGSSPTHTVDGSGDTVWAYITPVVSVRLADITVVEGAPTRVDINNNVDTAIAYRAGATYFDPCCNYGINLDLTNICGTEA